MNSTFTKVALGIIALAAVAACGIFAYSTFSTPAEEPVIAETPTEFYTRDTEFLRTFERAWEQQSPASREEMCLALDDDINAVHAMLKEEYGGLDGANAFGFLQNECA